MFLAKTNFPDFLKIQVECDKLAIPNYFFLFMGGVFYLKVGGFFSPVEDDFFYKYIQDKKEIDDNLYIVYSNDCGILIFMRSNLLKDISFIEIDNLRSLLNE